MIISRKKILVVEDNLINRMMLCEILSSNYEVLEAENGQEALLRVKEYGEGISLILLDIMMPVMDGYTFLSLIKADSAYSSIPVIVTTQSDGESDEVAALSHGAADFVAKPYRPQIILHRVANIIHLRETAAMINLIQYDRLTGMYGKEFFYQRVREILIQHPDKEYDIICSNIENFKLYNDIFGTPAGDRLLVGIAELFLRLVGDKGICSRINADMFVCLLEHRWEYTDEMFIDVSAQVNALSSARSIVMKWGIYPIRDRVLPVEQMCDRAILVVRSIKGQYRKYFAAYDEELRSEMLREQAITDSMEQALAEGQFEIYLQPKYRIKDNELAGAEALVRWNHPEWGVQSPAQFIPLFERNGFITRLDQFVWKKACEVLKDWDNKGYPVIPVSVNVSRADINNADIVDILNRTVEEYGLPHSRLHLEITESAYTENPNQIIDTAGYLRELGFVIEMDDFGSGYSSLNMLNKMPIDILKLDMKFIQSETAKPINQGILRFIMGLARWMNLTVVAEGVETSEQMERLRAIGCDYVQGYYFAKPMPCREFEELIKKQEERGEEIGQQARPAGLKDQLPLLLIADEDEAYRRELRQLFEGSYRVLESDSAETTLSCIAGNDERIAVVILSLTMLGPDGYSVLEILQREKTVWGIPVIVTAEPDETLEEMALELGADDFAVKPHLPKSMWRRVMRAVNISESEERERVLQEEANRDYLTGLLNRRGLKAATEALKPEDAPLAVYLFDLGNMKKLNDTLGHQEGDRMLTQFGELLRTHTRGTDILARFDGDEFIAIMKQMKSDDSALKKGGAICQAIRESIISKNVPMFCHAGIAIWNGEASISEIIERAAQALHRAKTGSEDGCCLWGGRSK